MRTACAIAAPADLPREATAFLLPSFAALPPMDLLAHFREVSPARYLPVSRGKAKHLAQADRILRHEFTFNNETHVLPAHFDWTQNPSCDLEWLILLHKFYYSRDLVLAYDYSGDERYARKWLELVTAWIEQVPEGYIDSQVTGRRILQWLLAFQHLIAHPHCPSLSPEFLLELLLSLETQAMYLTWNLTPEGNHRTIELYAIFSVAVLFPEFRHAADLLDFAQRELLRNLQQDFLADGVHRELSTDYHHTVLKNFLHVRDLARLNKVELPAEFDDIIGRAVDFSIYVHKPDGLIPAINDGDVNSYLSLLRKAHQHYSKPEIAFVASGGESGVPPIKRSRSFPDSGYCVLRSDWREQPYRDGRYFVFDCGGLGFGSHGHYDLLGFEAAAYGRSLIVDPGRYTYHDDGRDGTDWRRAFKGTAAHNTVMVDGLDQIEYRCGRPVGPEPQAQLREFVSALGFDFAAGSATSPRYDVEHRRQVFFPFGEYWIVTDHLIAPTPHHYDCSFHLGTEAWESARRLRSVEGIGVAAPGLLVAQPDDGSRLAIEEGFVSPEYGIRQHAPVIRFSRDAAGDARFHTVVYPFPDQRPVLSLRSLQMASANNVALRIEIGTTNSRLQDHYFLADDAMPGNGDFEDIVCRARMLYLRRDAGGAIVSLQALELEYLSIASEILWASHGRPVQLSCDAQHWQLLSSGRQWQGDSALWADLQALLADLAQRLGEGAA